jgi:hypothetical protein
MKFIDKRTGAILEPASDMVVEQMKKSPDFEIAGEKTADDKDKKKDLKKMKVDELKALAAELGIEVPDDATKADMIDLIEKAQA